MDLYMNKENFLGGWKVEEIITRAQFTAPKRYKAEVDGHTYVKAGGINFNEYITQKAKAQGITELGDLKDFINHYEFAFDEINIISSVWKVQRAYRVKGGTIIEFQDKEMKVPKKYLETFKNNV